LVVFEAVVLGWRGHVMHDVACRNNTTKKRRWRMEGGLMRCGNR
jgi:hypothetical protein